MRRALLARSAKAVFSLVMRKKIYSFASVFARLNVENYNFLIIFIRKSLILVEILLKIVPLRIRYANCDV